MSKGAGTAISSIIIIIMIIGLAFFFYYVIYQVEHQERKMNLKEAELLKGSNSFYLSNRSLYFTWNISTVQIIFDAGEMSIGVPHWFERSMYDETDIFMYQPDTDERKEDLEKFMGENMKSDYTVPVQGSLSLPNGVVVSVLDTESAFEYIYGTGADTIISNVSNILMVSFEETYSSSSDLHRFFIPSFFSEMIDAGIVFSSNIKQFSGTRANYLYLDDDTISKFQQRLRDNIDTLASGVPTSSNVELNTSGVRAMFYFVPNTMTNRINIGGIRHQGGLVLQYFPYAIFEEVYSDEDHGYYYHRETANRFEKIPFFLRVNANDTVPILDCTANSNKKYNIDRHNHVMCYLSAPRGDTYPELYTCGVPGLSGQEGKNRIPSGKCFNSQIECRSNRFMDCNTLDCLNYCANAPGGHYWYHGASPICEEAENGCHCNYDRDFCPTDNDLCTTDCIASRGCVYQRIDCSDTDLCTTNERCEYGVCRRDPVECPTGTSCDSSTGDCV